MAQRPIKGEAWQADVTEHRRFQRVADEFDRQLLKLGAPGAKTQLGPGVCKIKNGSGSAVERFGILGVDDVWLSPTDSAPRFCAFVPLTGNSPTIADHDGKFVVLMEPAGDEQTAFAVNSGITPVQIQVTAGLEWYGYADVTDDDATKLTLLPSGAAQVLWKEEGTGTKWAIVRLGAPHGNPTLRMKLDAELVAKSSAAASIWKGDPLADTGNNCTLWGGDANGSLMSTVGTGSSFPVGKFVWGMWFPDSRKWEISNAGC